MNRDFFDQMVRRSEFDKDRAAIDKAAMGRIWNLTPHAMHYDDGQARRSNKSDGSIRLEKQNEAVSATAAIAAWGFRYLS